MRKILLWASAACFLAAFCSLAYPPIAPYVAGASLFTLLVLVVT